MALLPVDPSATFNAAIGRRTPGSRGNALSLTSPTLLQVRLRSHGRLSATFVVPVHGRVVYMPLSWWPRTGSARPTALPAGTTIEASALDAAGRVIGTSVDPYP